MNELVNIENGKIVVRKETIKKLKDFQEKKLQMDLMEKELKEGLKEAMELIGKNDLEIDGLKIKYKEPYVRKSINSSKLKVERPEIYEGYLRETKVSGSVSISFEE